MQAVKNSLDLIAPYIIHRDVAQLVARLVWDQDVAGSNPVIPTKNPQGISVPWGFLFGVRIWNCGTFSLIYSTHYTTYWTQSKDVQVKYSSFFAFG